MDEKARQMMGEEVLAGVTLEAKKSVKGVIGGAIGGLIGELLADIELKPAAVPGDHDGIHYLAVGPSKVGFFSMKRGLFKPSLNELLVQVPREQVLTLEIKPGAMPEAHIVLQDGTHYVLMCARIHLKKLKKIRKILAPQTS